MTNIGHGESFLRLTTFEKRGNDPVIKAENSKATCSRKQAWEQPRGQNGNGITGKSILIAETPGPGRNLPIYKTFLWEQSIK